MARKVTKAAEIVRWPIAAGTLYPHFKLTREKFPRLLVTRKILDPADEYFGAMLPNTSVRIWLYHLNKIFRLRSCDLNIYGNWPLPCAKYFSKECAAPCVTSLCDQQAYGERVEAVRLFLANSPGEFEVFVTGQIDRHAEALEFERAAEWRDLLKQAKHLAAAKRLEIRIDRAVDTYSVIETADDLLIYLITSRGRRMVGNREFVFEKNAGWTAESAIEAILRGFYQFSVPREIRLPLALTVVREIQRNFVERFGRSVKFAIHGNELNDGARQRLRRTQVDFGLEKIGPDPTPGELGAELKRIFGLRRQPRRIEAFDVAHISNQDFVTVSCVWIQGEIRPDRAWFWTERAESEPQALAYGVRDRMLLSRTPDLILVDGGRAQLNAVKKVLSEIDAGKVPVIAAAKPAGQHKEIAQFFTSHGGQVEFVSGNRALELLRELRDEAHQNANELHRQQRENRAIFENVNAVLLLEPSVKKVLLKHFGSRTSINEVSTDELAKVVGLEMARRISYAALMPAEVPLVITRMNEIGGMANDLRPIKTPLVR